MRKPARLERAGALTPRDRMWAAIRALQLTPTCSWSPVEVQFLANLKQATDSPACGDCDLPADCRVHVDTVRSYVEALSRARPPYVELVLRDIPNGRKRRELWLWRLVRDAGVEAPRVTSDGKPVTQGAANERMWASMQVLREFDTLELAQAASGGGAAVSEETAKTYARFLERAGYLAIVQQARPWPNPQRARYRFIRSKNTGPRAPLIARDKSVMDANTGETVWTPTKGDVECKRT